jgi:hypothetical protein
MYHTHAQSFMNLFVPSKNAGTPPIFWERPVLVNQGFAAQPFFGTGVFGIPLKPMWYGNAPQPDPQPTLGGAQEAWDPRTLLPLLVTALQSYLSIEMLIPVINSSDPSQPMFAGSPTSFVSQYSGDLATRPGDNYADWLEELHTKAANGIVKSDLPSVADLLGFLNSHLLPLPILPFPGGSTPHLGPDTAGNPWNGVYGAVDAYPVWGFYQPPPPVPVPGAAPSFVIDTLPDVAGFAQALEAQRSVDGSTISDLQRFTTEWVVPWLQNRLILGRMARLKAIYLLNGYDQVWPLVQKLRFLTNPSPPILLAQPKPLDQDHTIPNGNWSARELFSILNFAPDITEGLNFSPEVVWSEAGEGLPGTAEIVGYSVFTLVGVFSNIANGSWIGAPFYGDPPPVGWIPPRPVSFRDQLRAAAGVDIIS